MRFNIGDKVKIREDLVVGESYGSDCFTKSMDKFKGRVVTIKEVSYNYSYYWIEECGYNWTDEMLEPYFKTNTKAQVLKDDVGEYLELELERNNQIYNIQFYLSNNISLRTEPIFARKNGKTTLLYPAGQEVVFDVRKWSVKELKKKMSKDDIEKALGYKIEIVEE